MNPIVKSFHQARSWLLGAIAIWTLLTPAVAAGDDHLISTVRLRSEVLKRFERQKRLARHRAEPLFNVFRQKMTLAEREALQYLYAYLPLSDLADYDGEYLLGVVRTSLQARAEMPWGQHVPETLFLHFVLPPRVNNENLDTFRTSVYPELKNKVQKLSMREAVLEVNHWCHEKVTYQPTDERTGSPLSVMKTSWGRCGEESTFTVSALRTVGIPARQCYTPRWAHTDDNHAWVEVWVDGRWYFLGACEPAPDLDMSWFKEPARRTVLVHTRGIGPAPFDEPVLEGNQCFSLLNLTARYAPVKTFSVRVLDQSRRPIPGAEVRFLLYNSAELYPVSVQRTGVDGRTSLSAGLGDLVVWASQGERFGFSKVSVGTADEAEIILNRSPGDSFDLELDLVPPVERPPLPSSDAGMEENNRRLKAEDTIRNAYMATFMGETAARRLAVDLGLDGNQIWKYIQKSAGNWIELEKFLRQVPADQKPWAMPLLGTLSDKDLRDTRADVLQDHLAGALKNGRELAGRDGDLFVQYVLAPRVAFEMLVAYRKLLQDEFPKLVGTTGLDADGICSWIVKNVAIDSTANYSRAPLTPRGVFALRVADPHSRDIFFVAACRSLGIPARLEPVFRIPQYWRDGRWVDVSFSSAGRTSQKTTLTLAHDSGEGDPRYYAHFTLAQIRSGVPQTLEFDIDQKLSSFPKELEVPAGDYLLVSGNRQADGTVLARLQMFSLSAGSPVHRVPVIIRKEASRLESFGRLDMNTTVKRPDGKEQYLYEMAGWKGAVLLWLEPGAEPSRHTVEDIAALKQKFEEWGGAIVALLPSGQAVPPEYEKLPAQTVFAAETDNTVLTQVLKAKNRGGGVRYPVMVIITRDGGLVFFGEGYTIGSGDQLLKTINRME